LSLRFDAGLLPPLHLRARLSFSLRLPLRLRALVFGEKALGNPLVAVFLLPPPLGLGCLFSLRPLVLQLKLAAEALGVGQKAIVFGACDGFVPLDFMAETESSSTLGAYHDGGCVSRLVDLARTALGVGALKEIWQLVKGIVSRTRCVPVKCDGLISKF
jgi:hypothetical protein